MQIHHLITGIILLCIAIMVNAQMSIQKNLVTNHPSWITFLGLWIAIGVFIVTSAVIVLPIVFIRRGMTGMAIYAPMTIAICGAIGLGVGFGITWNQYVINVTWQPTNITRLHIQIIRTVVVILLIVIVRMLMGIQRVNL